MKRLLLSTLLLTVLFLNGVVLAFAQNSEPSAEAVDRGSPPAAVIREITGTVELKRPGEAWTAANPGDRIDRATIISTSFRSTAILAVGSSTLVVRPITRLSLENLLIQNKTEMVNINLRSGRVRVDVTPAAGNKSNFTVRSPSAVASVRGTSFEMDTISIQVLEGTVSYVSVDDQMARQVRVGAGQESWVDAETSDAVNPMAAAETIRSHPDLPGEEAGTLSDDIRLAVPKNRSGSFGVEVLF